MKIISSVSAAVDAAGEGDGGTSPSLLYSRGVRHELQWDWLDHAVADACFEQYCEMRTAEGRCPDSLRSS